MRKYVRKIGAAYLRPEDYDALVKKEAIILFSKPKPGWKNLIGYEPDPEYFREVSFIQRQAFYQESFVRVLLSFNEKAKTIYEHVQWYPDGDLKVRPKRTIILRHASSFKHEEVRSYFIEPKLIEQWLSGGDAECVFDAEKNRMSVSVVQDHYFDWYYLKRLRHHIEIEQVWMEKYKSRITVKFNEVSNGTEISVFINGIISIKLEEEYRNDWEGIRNIP